MTCPFPEQQQFSGGGRVTLHSNIFQPPRTPGLSHMDKPTSSSSSSITTTTAQDNNRPSLARKRSRANSNINKANSSAPLSYASKDIWSPQVAASPAPLANEHYTLDYKFDTPTLAAALRHDDLTEGDRDARWKWSDLSPEQQDGKGEQARPAGPGLLARERNGKGRSISYGSMASDAPETWSRFAIKLVGGVVGKMWHFCRPSAFAGFHAGEGRGFDFSQPTQFDLPGQYPDTNFFGDFEQDNDAPVRALKRQHTESGWVMVDSTTTPLSSTSKTCTTSNYENLTHLAATRASNRRALSSVTRRPLPSRQTSYTGSPQATAATHSRLDVFSQAFASTASTASTRSPNMSASTSAISPRFSAASPIRTSFSPGNRRASLATTTATSATIAKDTLSPEAQRYIHRLERQDRDVEKSMRKMSRQIEDLIRQGQVALGTQFDVESDGIDDDNDADDDDGDWEDARL
jgi:hypothetical protein